MVFFFTFFILLVLAGLRFLFVWTMRRSILRWVDRIILSCSLDSVHVPEASLSVEQAESVLQEVRF